MFSKSKISETTDKTEQPRGPAPTVGSTSSASAAPASASATAPTPTYAAKPKPSPSLLSSDLTIKGNVITSGDIQVEGKIEGDVRAHLLTVGESAEINGEIVADDVVVNGKVVGRVRGLKVRLTASARVEGDIVHKTIAIESGAHFEGSVQRQEDPLGNSGNRTTPRAAAADAG
ncbi:polymer-forming cytoskeletal protein [Limibaculum sp. FT325]|uniref:bactofilin family protein n=1 Tax=Thermohalobaculum sediminis TaxID=2939436 RepID=UPI0020C1127B|nr:polymer-forming cytoskeletal protein [Limibaculum sediminis]MCL5778709.1 polymer-forming cytoskeletal protein [Limibaculum sediminis]